LILFDFLKCKNNCFLKRSEKTMYKVVLAGIVCFSHCFSLSMEKKPGESKNLYIHEQRCTDEKPGDSSDSERDTKKPDIEDGYSFEQSAGQFEILTP
jgi:hypothetical protein